MLACVYRPDVISGHGTSFGYYEWGRLYSGRGDEAALELYSNLLYYPYLEVSQG